MSASRIISIILRGSDQASPAIKKVRGSMDQTKKAAGLLSGAVGALGVSFGAAGLASVLRKSTAEFMQFETAVSRIGTLIPGQRAMIDSLADSADNLSRVYGLMADDVATATFQAVSAGVAAGEATEFMSVAARSATAGFSSMEETVMGLTTIINAYGLEVSEAERISDAMFAANKLGVTTTQQLSQHMGTVVSVASSLNVSYQDVLASTVAMTKQGLDTGRSMVSLRGILTTLISPSEDAAKAAEEFGIQWNGAMVKARGMTGVMEELQKANEIGGAELVSRLIPNVRALSGAMALASTTGVKDFTASLTEMNTRVGQTGDALKEVTDSAAHKYSVAMQELASSSRTLGGVSLPIVGRALGFVAKHLSDARDSFSDYNAALRTAIRLHPFTTVHVNAYELAFGNLGETIDASTVSNEENTESMRKLGVQTQSQTKFIEELRKENEKAVVEAKAKLEFDAEVARIRAGNIQDHAALVAANKKYYETINGVKFAEEEGMAITSSYTDVVRKQTAAVNALRAAKAALGEFEGIEPGGSVVDVEQGVFTSITSNERSAALIIEAEAADKAALAHARFRHEMESISGSSEGFQQSIQKNAEETSRFASESRDGFGVFANAYAGALDAAISGESGFAAAMQAATKAALRSISKQATVKALWEGAEGVAALAIGQPGLAVLHFKSAGMYAAVAGVGALAARAVGTPGGGGSSGGGDRAVVSADRGLSAIAPAGSASGGQRTEVYYITIQGSLIRQAELASVIGRALDEAERRGAAPRR